MKYQRLQSSQDIIAGLISGPGNVIPDSALTASTTYNNNPKRTPRCSRLETPREDCDHGVWVMDPDDTDPWIMADLGGIYLVQGVTTKGRPTTDYNWVTSYKIAYSYKSTDMSEFVWYLNIGATATVSYINMTF